MAPDKSEIYKLAPTTFRKADFLAKRHGFKNVRALSDSLPKNARVIDVGAGASAFGKEVAALRSDASWINFDYSYSDASIVKELRKDSRPNNVQYVAGDATELAKQFKPETFDAVFSFWLFPHLSLKSNRPAEQAAAAIFEITKSNGLICIGPKMPKLGLGSLRSKKSLRFKKNTIDKNYFIAKVVNSTKMHGPNRAVQIIFNERLTPLLGTSRWSIKDEEGLKVRNPRTKNYNLVFGRKGLKSVTTILFEVLFGKNNRGEHNHE